MMPPSLESPGERSRTQEGTYGYYETHSYTQEYTISNPNYRVLVGNNPYGVRAHTSLSGDITLSATDILGPILQIGDLL